MPTTAERRTYDVEECAAQLGINRFVAYDMIRRTGHLAGVPVIHAGRRVLIPKEAFDRVLAGDGAGNEAVSS